MAEQMDDGSDVAKEWIATQDAVSTVFLPRKLPECANEEMSNNDFWFGDNNAFNDFAAINKMVLPDKMLKMLNTWNSCFHLASSDVLSSLENLDAGSTFPIHLPAQNAALTITNNDNEIFTVRGYNVQPETSVVMEATGPLITQQPCTSVCVPSCYILDDALVDQLTALQTCVFEEATAKRQYRHTSVAEYREATSPRFVFEWLFALLGVLGEHESTTSTAPITKKVRDRVVFPSDRARQSSPWRRHPTWLAFKFVLHGTLVNDNGYEMGTIIYKTAMLNFLTSFLKIDEHTEQPDLCHQMMAKVACRVHKLDVLLKQYAGDINAQAKKMADEAMNNSTRNLRDLSTLRNMTWKQLVTMVEEKRQLPELSTASLEPSLELKLASSGDSIQATLKPPAKPRPAKPGRMEKHASGVDVDNLNGSTRQGSIVGLYQWEEMVFNCWLSDSRHLFDKPGDCYGMLKAYNSASSDHYNSSDPIGQSRRLLTSTVLIALCDVATTSNQPLLLQHKPSVEVAFLQGVLATDHLQLQVVKCLEDYYQRRNTAAEMDGPLNPRVCDESLSSRYAANNPMMMGHLKSMLEEDERDCEAHKVHIQGLLEKVAHDEERLKGMACEYTTEAVTVTTTNHSCLCGRCKLDNELSERTGPIFERRLPEREDERRAIVFELLLPEDIQHWRDSIWYHRSKILGVQEYRRSSQLSPPCRKLWKKHLPPKTYGEILVTLGSTNVSFVDSHYRDQKLRCNIAAVDSFIKPCNLNCHLAVDNLVLKVVPCNIQILRQSCTFKLTTPALQEFINNTGHNQSEVIAKHGDRPGIFSRREFITYGSIRCGECLQWHSILRGLHDQSLTVNNMDVVQLICQCVWQAGSNEQRTVLRQSHQPLADSAFVQEFTSELVRLLACIRGNWQQHWALCAIVVLANRLLNLHTEEGNSSEENVRALQGVLLTCRHTAIEWLDQMKLLLDSRKCDNATDLQLYASRVAAFGALTYDNGTTLANQDSQPLKHWLQFITDMHRNKVLSKSRPTGILENLFDCVLRISIKQHSGLCELLKHRDHKKELWKFVSEFYCPGFAYSIESLDEENQLWVSFNWQVQHGQKENVQIDLREGQCWVNGLPFGRLPPCITTSSVFRRHFRSTVFHVQPCTGPHGQPAQRSTSSSGKFIFSDINFSGEKEVTIFEIHHGRQLLLIPHTLFSKDDTYDLPAHILNDTSIWFDLHSRNVYFRSIFFRKPEFSDLSSCNYILDFDSRSMSVCEGATVGVEPNSSLVELSSGIGSTLVTIFKKLELPKFMEIWQRPDGRIYILLPRLNLTFYALDGEGKLEIYSVDHNGWRVDNDQTIGTLIGLQHGLILVKYPATDYTQRCLLLPHSPVVVTLAAGSHPVLSFDIQNLGSPASFRYTLNSDLQQLQAPTSRAAWFLLAYIHGVTSSMQADPFTSMTGTEMAMTILQSARSWSNSPYDGYSQYWLECIKRLSPQRRYYPEFVKEMGTVVWPDAVSSMGASDAYAIVTDKLQEYSEQLQFLFQTSTFSVENNEIRCKFPLCPPYETDTSLNHAEYLRSFQSYPILARLARANSPDVNIGTKAFPVFKLSLKAQHTGRCVLLSRRQLGHLTPENIEAWLRGQGEGEFSFNDIDTGTLKDCAGWRGIDLQDSFMSFQVHLKDLRRSSQWRLHLALMLSFWSYVNKQNTHLLGVVIALCSTDVEVVPPCSRIYPNASHSLPSVCSIIEEPFVASLEEYARKHGLNDVQSLETDREVAHIPQTNSWALVAEYKLQKRQLNHQLQECLSKISDNLRQGPIGYDHAHPTLPENFLGSLTSDITDLPACRKFLMEHFQRSNLLLILKEYAQRLSSAASQVPELTASKFSSHTGKITIRHHHNDYSFNCQCEGNNTVRQLEELVERNYNGPRVKLDDIMTSPKLNTLVSDLAKDDDPITKEFSRDLQRGRKALSYQKINTSADPTLKEQKAMTCRIGLCLQKSVEDFINVGDILAAFLPSATLPLSALSACGLLHRTSPLALLPAILPRWENTPGFIQYSFAPDVRNAIEGMAVQLVKKQRFARLQRLLADKQWDWLWRELSCVPHADWSPRDHVEWLLFEVENDVTIWPKQVHVAEKMMSNEGKKHIVVQLNMGEGKTSVILPVIAAELADGQSLVRVVVLTSLYTTNYQQLVFKLGGMLGHRVCSLPFRRDVCLELNDIENILSFLNGCRDRRDVMVTVREHLLSLLLKYEESCCEPRLLSLAASLHQIVAMMQSHARDVLDEADEILHHQYQLIYPSGIPHNPDGGEVRWIAAEVILEAVKTIAKELNDRFPSCVSYTHTTNHGFPSICLLEPECHLKAYPWLCEKIIEFIFAGESRILPSELMDCLSSVQEGDREGLKEFLKEPEINEQCVVLAAFAKPTTSFLLCVRGLLAKGVLLLCLKKRYRVEYGLPSMSRVSKKAEHRNNRRIIRMAVPFRAKDVASERTEFGHTDVAVLLTLLSYYQHGLTTEEVNILLDRLHRKETKSDVYNSWVAAADDKCVHTSIRELDGINRKDATQMTEWVVPFLQSHTAAINFYLNHDLFPRDLKEFRSKLEANSWSMTPVERRLKVTGFSGTNDTRHLLPASTKQDDLPELQHTNTEVCNVVLARENNVYSVFKQRQLSCELMLEEIVAKTPEINTIIDAGALILNQTNEEFARCWLHLRQMMKGVVYFDSDDQLQVLTRQQQGKCKLELSPYADNLSECLVYLDHAHCRGTDLRMAKNTVAAVTLGKGLRRDELMQACMRMRRLGIGHTLTFWAPPEVDHLIRQQCRIDDKRTPQNYHVVHWCFLNSISATRDGFYAWATQGLAHLRVSDALYGETTVSRDIDSQQYAKRAEQFMFPDCMTLKEMYGLVQNDQRVPEIIQHRAIGIRGAKGLVKRCKRFVPDVRRCSETLDEEQEREMEQEIEAEHEVQHAPVVGHVKEECDTELLHLAETGALEASFHRYKLQPLWKCLVSTSLRGKFSDFLEHVGFKLQQVLATKSFASVVHDAGDVTNLFLRPVHWLLYVRGSASHEDILVALSPYEADQVVMTGKWSPRVSLLMYSTPLRLQQRIMADWACTVAGKRIPRLCEGTRHLQQLFAEIFLYSGGLFFGAVKEDMLPLMESLASLLQLSPGPQDVLVTRQLVRFTPPHTQGGLEPMAKRRPIANVFSLDPVPFLRELMAILHSSDSLELSDVGDLLLRHSWVQPRDPSSEVPMDDNDENDGN